HLFRIAARRFGETAPDHFHLSIKHVDHGVKWAHVAVFEQPSHGILHYFGRWARISVIEIDDVAVDGEGIADLAPVVFIRGCFFRSFAANSARSRSHAFDGVVLECDERGPGREAKEVSAVHGSPEHSTLGASASASVLNSSQVSLAVVVAEE